MNKDNEYLWEWVIAIISGLGLLWMLGYQIWRLIHGLGLDAGHGVWSYRGYITGIDFLFSMALVGFIFTAVPILRRWRRSRKAKKR